MINNKKIFSKKSLSTFIGGVLFVIFSVTLTLTSFAWFTDGKFAGGIIRFGEIGIEAIAKNLTSGSIGQSGVSLSSQADFHLFIDAYSDGLTVEEYDNPLELSESIFDNVKQNDGLRIVNPTLEPNSLTVSYYLRSKWQVLVGQTVISEQNWATQANIERLPEFGSEWVLGPGDYYYCVNQNVTQISSVSDLKENSNNGVSTGEVLFFNVEEDNLFIKIEDTNYNTNIQGIEIRLIIEVIEADSDYVTQTWLS